MPAEISALIDGIDTAAQRFSSAATLLALLAFLVEFVRGRAETRSFRPAVGWAVAVLGLFGCAAATIAVRDQNVWPLGPGGHVLGAVLVAGGVLFVAGTAMAILTPSADRGTLHGIASAVESAVQRCEVEDNFVRANRVALGIVVSDKFASPDETWRTRARQLSEVRLPPASVLVLAGAPGSGKSVELRARVLEICRGARQSRRPRELAVYVSLRRLPAIEGKITQDVVAGHLLQAVSEDNGTLAEHLRRYLEGETVGPRWLFVFDLDGELSREQEKAYFQAVRNLMRHRDRDQALMAVREAFPDVRPVLRLCPPTPRQVRQLLQKRGIGRPADYGTREPALREVFASPSMIMHVLSTETAPRSAAELLDAFVAVRLDRHAAPHGDVTSLRHKAEAVAYRQVFHPASPPSPEDETPLLVAQLGRREHGVFAFRFPSLRTHLASAQLAATTPLTCLADLVGREETRVVTRKALSRGDEDFGSRFLVLVENAALTLSSSFADVEEDELPPVDSFTWDPVVLHALTILRDLSPATRPHLSTRLRSAIDHLVWKGFFSGGRHNRDASLSLLPLVSQKRVLALYQQAASFGLDPRTLSLIALHLRWEQDTPEWIGLHDRATVLFNAVKAWSKGQFLPSPEEIDENSILYRMLQRVLTICRVSSAAGGVMLLAFAATFSSVDAVAVLCAIALALFGVAWCLRGGACGLSDFWARVTYRVTKVVWFACLIFSALSVLGLLANSLPPKFEFLTKSLLLLLVFTWPVAMTAEIVNDPRKENHRWVFPHLVVTDLRDRRAELARYSGFLDEKLGHMWTGWRRTTLIVSGLAFVFFLIDMPIPELVEVNIDSFAGLAVAIAVVVAARPVVEPPVLDTEEVVGSKVFNGTMIEEELLLQIQQHAEAGPRRIDRLLRTFAAAPDGALHGSVGVLESLDKLLEFLERTMPDPPASPSTARQPIKPGAWSYAPESCAPSVRDWAVEFDRENPGVLVELANSEKSRTSLSRAIKSANASLKTTRSVTASLVDSSNPELVREQAGG